jgi:hypothetical protein
MSAGSLRPEIDDASCQDSEVIPSEWLGYLHPEPLNKPGGPVFPAAGYSKRNSKGSVQFLQNSKNFTRFPVTSNFWMYA